MHLITPKKNVRILARTLPDRPLLHQTGGMIEAGTEIEIGEPRTMSYDHSDLLCVPVQIEGKEFYLIVNEIGALNKPLNIFKSLD